ncbi:hypothetical protein D3P07_10045 [Paenibacillus sp. 1011MAR3C5]|uniref:hypothetical protein n=1 Tax=Paenibacillus sp. 1011MAR3C5 TaxID=1675787 RepID=UPI000E6C41AD|nr:hypothetical protein [Paenibacillus sp. 1011MAR3C5]RJE88343.1 hypothetical protein D3P07_10045 [Paenibacillus sp. 1011MAR3C5]
MNKYKSFIQNQYEKAKSTASGFISSRGEEQEEGTIELNSQYYVELKAIADMQGTNVQAFVNGIIAQYLVSVNAQYESIPISVDQKEENPLLYLDGICKLED